MPAQCDCIVSHVISNGTHAALTRSFGSFPPRPLSLAASPHSRRSPGSSAPACVLSVVSEDEDDVAELVALLTRARLVPASSRRPIAAALCAAGIGSAEALSQVIERDAMFLTHQVPAVRFAA